MLLGEEELKGAALLVFANKQDIQGALGAGEIAEKLELAKKCKERSVSSGEGVDGRNWSIRACSAVKKEGLTEGLDWYAVSLTFLTLGWLMSLMTNISANENGSGENIYIHDRDGGHIVQE